MDDKPSFAMKMMVEDSKRERSKDRIFGIIIVTLMLLWTFSMYMIFSYFSNVTTIGGNSVVQSAENGGENNTNTIDQRG